jgi:FkbM family methyltransferase
MYVEDRGETILAKVLSPILHFYGHVLPYHRGKWRVCNGLISLLEFDTGEIRRAERRGIVWELDLGSYLDCRLYYMGVHEPWETRFVERVTKPGFVFFDVGANIGYFTLLSAKRMGAGCQVHSFEPSSEEFAKLSRNVRLNRFSMIHLNQLAVSDVPGKVYMTETRSAGTTRIATKTDTPAIEVQAVSLDSYVETLGISRLDMIKVDIEGAEYKFLLGAFRTLKRFRPLMIIELNPKALAAFGASPEGIVGLARSLGYSFYTARPSGLRSLVRLPTGFEFFNAIALPSQLAEARHFISWRSLVRLVARRESGERLGSRTSASIRSA